MGIIIRFMFFALIWVYALVELAEDDPKYAIAAGLFAIAYCLCQGGENHGKNNWRNIGKTEEKQYNEKTIQCETVR